MPRTSSPIRLEIVEPGWFSWSGAYTFHAELDTAGEDRFQWQLDPCPGTLALAPNALQGRESMAFRPDAHRAKDQIIRIRLRHIGPAALRFEACFSLPAAGPGISSVIPGGPGEPPQAIRAIRGSWWRW